MRLHVALRRERLEQASTAADAADLTARRRFGDPLRLREDAMDAWGVALARASRAGCPVRDPQRLSRIRVLLSPPSARSRSASARTPPSSALSVPRSSARCRSPTPVGWSEIYGTSPLEPHGGRLEPRGVQAPEPVPEAVAGSEVTARYRTRLDGLEQVMVVRAERDFFQFSVCRHFRAAPSVPMTP